MKWIKLLLVVLVVLGVDIASKMYVHAHIPYLGLASPYFPYGGIGVFQGAFGGVDFSINHVHNTGAAWGAFSSFKHLLIFLRIGVIVALLIYFMGFNKVKGRDFPLLLVIVGAMGNVVDYFVYGHVVDFFLFSFWGYSYPLFNVADSAIFCGVALLIIHSFRRKTKDGQVHAD